MGKIKVFYHKNKNLGDVLAPIILTHLSGIGTEYAKPQIKGKLLSVGSIIPNKLKENDIIWGSGSLREEKFSLPSGVKVYSVRGKLTRDLIQQKEQVPEVYGDPALLMPSIYKPKVPKVGKIGLLPHFTDYWFIQGRYGNKDTINILGDPREIIKRMLGYEKIITSSMHGVILAEAYGIPVVWTKLIDPVYREEKGAEFKFADHFSITNRNFESVTWEDGVAIGNCLDKANFNLKPLSQSFSKMWKEQKAFLTR